MELSLGSFDEPNVFRPTYEAWISRCKAWLETPGLTRFVHNRTET